MIRRNVRKYLNSFLFNLIFNNYLLKGIAMKNSEYIIYIILKNRRLQKFRKEKDGWKE